MPKLLLAFAVSIAIINIVIAECDTYYQAYRDKSATFYVFNATKIKIHVYNVMGDLYPRCFTAWIIVNGQYVNLDGLLYSPSDWQNAWSHTAPNCFYSGYRITSLNEGYAEYDLLNFNNNLPYTGIVEVRVSSDCYAIQQTYRCFCWNVIVENIPSAKYDNLIDGWYNTTQIRCNLYGNYCGYGTKEMKQEYRDYTCIGSTCTYVVTARRWVVAGSCYKGCLQGKTCVNGYCKPIFDCNLLDGWYDTQEEKCQIELECGAGTKLVKEEYRDYYPIVYDPLNSSGCAFTVKNIRWKSVGSCYASCPSGYYCDVGICRQIKSTQWCGVRVFVKDKQTSLPIENAKVCYDSICYTTDSNGISIFYVNVGTYNLHISKGGYASKSLVVNCNKYENLISRTVTLEKIKT